MYKDEFNVANFLAHPDELIWQALTLRYKPVDLDVLPLYIVLVFTAPLMLWAMVRRPNLTLAGSVVIYIWRAHLRLESRVIPAGHTLVLQSVRLAVDVRVRGMVRHRRCGEDLVLDPVARLFW